MTQDKVMLLIDADNVSLDVIEQAVGWVGKHFGGPHVRRAYCTAESAVKHQAAFKRLSIRPMVNLAAGKNSTDIALAVDAIDLTLAERPDVVVIASSDSDFAPLVSRLREKGCRVIGVGQQGKTGDETRSVYDDYEVLEHRKGKPAPRSEGRGGSRARPNKSASAPPPRAPAAPQPAREVTSAPPPAVAVAPLVSEPAAVLASPASASASAPASPPAFSASSTSQPPSVAAEQSRPVRARSRGGRRKAAVQDTGGVAQAPAEASRAEPADRTPDRTPDRPRDLPSPQAPEPRAPDAAPSAEAKPARKPRRRRSSSAKRAAEAAPAVLP